MIEAPFLDNFNAAFFNTPSVGSSAPAVDDKNVYCAAGMSEDGTTKGVIVAFDKESLRQKWRTELPSGVGDSAVKLFDGLLYVCNNQGPICLNCETGQIVWESKLIEKNAPYSFQEVFLSVANDGVFVGSPYGVCYRINRHDGKIIYQYNTGENQVFYGAPLLFNDFSYWVSMSGNFYSINRYDFVLQFHIRLEYENHNLGGCFAGPKIAFNEVACVTQSGAVALISFDGKIKYFDKGYSKFIAESNYVNTRMLVSDVDGNVKWLAENLTPVHTANVFGLYLFGTPQVFGNKVVLTTYGSQVLDEKGRSIPGFSNIFVLERGEILEVYKIPIRMHALQSVQIDKKGVVFAQLTGFTSDTASKYCAITRIELPTLMEEYEIIEARRIYEENEAKRIAQEAEAKRKAEEEARRIAQEAETKRKAEEEAKRIAQEAEAKRKAEKEEAKRIAQEAEAKRKAEEEAKRIAQEAEAKRKEEEEAKAKNLAKNSKRQDNTKLLNKIETINHKDESLLKNIDKRKISNLKKSRIKKTALKKTIEKQAKRVDE